MRVFSNLTLTTRHSAIILGQNCSVSIYALKKSLRTTFQYQRTYINSNAEKKESKDLFRNI